MFPVNNLKASPVKAGKFSYNGMLIFFFYPKKVKYPFPYETAAEVQFLGINIKIFKYVMDVHLNYFKT